MSKNFYANIVQYDIIHKPNKSKGFDGNSVAAPVFKKVAQKLITRIPIEIEISKKDIDILF